MVCEVGGSTVTGGLDMPAQNLDVGTGGTGIERGRACDGLMSVFDGLVDLAGVDVRRTQTGQVEDLIPGEALDLAHRPPQMGNSLGRPSRGQQCVTRVPAGRYGPVLIPSAASSGTGGIRRKPRSSAEAP